MGNSVRLTADLMRQVSDLMLDVPPNFHFLTNDTIGEIYNGAGPDWMSRFSRKILTFLLRYFAAAFMIHDIEFHFNRDTSATKANMEIFHLANLRMWKNIKTINAAMFEWWNPRRYYWHCKGYLAYCMCEEFGWSAWIATGSQDNSKVIEVKNEIINT